MAAVTTADRSFHTTVGATEEVSQLNKPVKQVAIVNRHATQSLSVKITTSDTSGAAANTKATAATDITSLGLDTIVIAAGKREVVFKSPASRYIAIQAIASGAGTDMSVHGTEFFD